MIQNDIDNEGVNKVMIAACSRRSKTEAFNFDNVAISRANLREGVIWVRPDTDEARETTQEMAADYVRMGCSEIKYMTLPHVSEEAASNNSLLVVGGGIVGMTAAIEAAAAGYPVTLVEKSGQLGGGAAFEYKRVPEHTPVCRTGRQRRGRNGREDRGATARSPCTSIPRSPRPVVHRAVSRRTSPPKVRFHHHRKLRRHHHGLGCAQLRRQPVAGTRLRQDPGRGRPDRPGKTRHGGQRRPDQAPVRRQGSRERGVRAVRRPAFHQRRPPALLLRSLLPDLDQAGDVLQGPEPADRHQHHLLRPAHPGCRRRGLLPQRPAEGHHLHQGHGQ